MASVWEGRFAGFLKRVAALRESTSLELLPDLMPVLPVIEARAAEMHRWRDERLFAVRETGGGGGAGTFDTHSFSPPPGHLMIVTGIRVRKAAAGRVHADLLGTVQTTALVGARDTRWTEVPGSFGMAGINGSRATPAVLLNTQWGVDVAVTTYTDLLRPGEEAVVDERSGLRVQNATANEALESIIYGYTVPVQNVGR